MTLPLTSSTAPADAAAQANTYSDLNGLASLKRDPQSPQSLRAVAQQVDALFLQMMLKSMREAGASIGESDSNEMGMYQDMFDKQIALNLSQHQNLGLGALLTRQLGAAGTPTATPAKTAAPGATAPGQVPAARPASQPAATGTATPASTAPAAPAGASTTIAHSAEQFVAAVLPAIRSAAQALGVSPLGLLAQAALETGWGKRMARNADGTSSLNLFGIKADGHWGGQRATAGTMEVVDGVATRRQAVFRAYGSIEESVNDFAQLLKNSPKFQLAVAAGQDPQAFINHMGRSGYATDPGYADKLSGILHGSTLRAAVKTGSTKV
jgi:peptidoglycan hydrolase FlgJ